MICRAKLQSFLSVAGRAYRRRIRNPAFAAVAGLALTACQPATDSPVRGTETAGAAPAVAASAGDAVNAAYRVPPNYAATPAPVQPVAFSHAAHAGMIGLPCVNCHIGAGPAGQSDHRSAGGAHMTLPQTSACMGCHAGVAVDRPAIAKLAEFDAAGQEVPWVRVYRVLEGVNWSHKPHIESGMTCQTCHGDVARMEAVSVATAVTAMSTCIGCHRSGQANANCETCHSWPLPSDL